MKHRNQIIGLSKASVKFFTYVFAVGVAKNGSMCNAMSDEKQAGHCIHVVRTRVVVSVSTSRSRDVPTYRLGLGHLCLVPKTNFRPNCAGHSTQCEWALAL